MYRKIIRAIALFVSRVVFFVKRENVDVLKKNNITGSCVLASNHICFFDPFLIGAPLKRDVYFMAKAELFKNKVFAKMILGLGAFPVHREKTDISAVKRALEILKQGHILGIFPQGTRINTDEDIPAKLGAAQFAFRTNSPIIPVGISTKDNTVKPFRQITVKYGEPIYLDKLGITDSKTESMEKASQYIMKKITELRK